MSRPSLKAQILVDNLIAATGVDYNNDIMIRTFKRKLLQYIKQLEVQTHDKSSDARKD